MTDERPVNPIHALLDEAATHQAWSTGNTAGVCCLCWEPWPCLVTRLAAEVYALRKQRLRDD